MLNYPLNWPDDAKRTLKSKRKRRGNSFDWRWPGWDSATIVDLLEDDFGADDVEVTSNLKPKRDGYVGEIKKDPDDPGAAVAFTYKGVEYEFGCDAYVHVADNLAALLAKLKRLIKKNEWKRVHHRKRAEARAAQAEEPSYSYSYSDDDDDDDDDDEKIVDWRAELGEAATIEEVKRRYNEAVKRWHPDLGRDDADRRERHERTLRLAEAMRAARAYFASRATETAT